MRIRVSCIKCCNANYVLVIQIISDDDSINMDAKSGSSDDDIFDEFDDEDDRADSGNQSEEKTNGKDSDSDDDDDDNAMDYSD